MKHLFMLLFLCVTLNAHAFSTQAPSDDDLYEEIKDLEKILDRAEDDATAEGRKVLVKSRSMISNGVLVLGSCWDYINEIYNRAGYPSKRRKTFYSGKFKGPYVEDHTTIEGGDWLYFVNHSYHGGEHSGIFVDWTDYNRKEALVISYVGGNRQQPARYKTYILTNVYNIIRPKRVE